MSLELTKKQQKMYDGEFGEGVQIAMEILVALGKIYNARSMIPITSVQVAGVSYKTIGDAGLEFIKEMRDKGAKVRVPAFLNPAGMDREQWEKMGVPAHFARKQMEIFDIYESMGINPTYTCTPYLIGIRPKIGEHVAWAESSAVSFANSVLGARTNREGGPSALAAAICGITPNYGLHLDENRIANKVVIIDESIKLEDRADYGLLGLKIGKLAKGSYPAFENLPKEHDEDKLKYLGAAMAASGSVPLFFARGITPEYCVSEDAERIEIGKSELEELKERISTDLIVDLISTGCPHASIKEIEEIAEMLNNGKRLKTKLWICCARQIKNMADEKGYTKIIEDAGGRIVADTCMVVSPIEQMGFKKTAVNSGKATKYLPTMCKQEIAFDRLGKLIENCTEEKNHGD